MTPGQGATITDPVIIDGYSQFTDVNNDGVRALYREYAGDNTSTTNSPWKW